MIVGVAIKIGEHIEIRLPAPNRHRDCFHFWYEMTGIEMPKLVRKTGRIDQGFYTDRGVYLSRTEAYKHVDECGQTLLRYAPRILTSEDLW